jgi:hypothetical protein
MLPLFSDKRPWFPVKQFGYGAGLPIVWQGWGLMLVYIAVLVGLGLLAERTGGIALTGIVALMALLTVLFVLIVKARTNGAWRWRWGEDV